MLLQSIVLREVCENIFKDLMQLVKYRNDPIHSENNKGKWIALREVVDRVFCDLQILSVEARDEALNNWFREVIKSMESVEVKRNKIYLSDSPFYLDLSTIVSRTIKEGLNTSWLTQLFVNPQIPVLKNMKMKDPEEDKRVEKLSGIAI